VLIRYPQYGLPYNNLKSIVIQQQLGSRQMAVFPLSHLLTISALTLGITEVLEFEIPTNLTKL
jgi:hypothetical protein